MSECDHTPPRSPLTDADAQKLFTQPIDVAAATQPTEDTLMTVRPQPTQPPDFTFVSTGLHQGEATLHGQPIRDLAFLEVSDGVDQHPQVTVTLRPRAGMSLVLPHAGVTVIIEPLPGYRLIRVDHVDRAESTWTTERIAPE